MREFAQCKVCGHTTDHYDKNGACLSEPIQYTTDELNKSIEFAPWEGCSKWGYDVERLFKYKGAIAEMTRIRTNMLPAPFTEDEIRDSLMINNQPERQWKS